MLRKRERGRMLIIGELRGRIGVYCTIATFA